MQDNTRHGAHNAVGAMLPNPRNMRHDQVLATMDYLVLIA